jgi:hypothetical protein
MRLDRFKLADQFIANAVDRDQVLRLSGIVFQFGSQRGQVIIHCARGRHGLVTPNFFKQFIPCHHRITAIADRHVFDRRRVELKLAGALPIPVVEAGSTETLVADPLAKELAEFLGKPLESVST